MAMDTNSEEPFVGAKRRDASTRDKTEEVNTSTHDSTNVEKGSSDTPINVASDEENVNRESAYNDKKRACGTSKQLVPYDPKANGSHENESDEAANQLVLYDPKSNGSNELLVSNTPRVLPAVGAFTVQCATCFKWRFIPTKGKYEKIREHILDQPFVCEEAKEWRPEISCEDPADIEQDGSRLWAIDKPNIAQPPPGWERELRIRGEGSSKFADVYYIAPTGKRLRSMVEVQKYLTEHPEFVQGVTMSQFSFQTPKPLQENYVRKRPAKRTASLNASNLGTSRSLKPEEVRPLSFATGDDGSGQVVLRLTGPVLSDSCPPQPCENYDGQPSKVQKMTSAPIQSSDTLHGRIKMKIGYSQPPSNNVW